MEPSILRRGLRGRAGLYALVVAVAVVVIASSVGTGPFSVGGPAQSATRTGAAPGSVFAHPRSAARTALSPDCIIVCVSPYVECTIAIYGSLGLFGPACLQDITAEQVAATNTANLNIAEDNIMTALNNYLNLTNAEVANLNATMQELLSFFESRAEAIVPFFLTQNWSKQVYDQIAIDSGLAPAIAGLESVIATQEYEDWNATINGWNAAFGPSGAWKTSEAALGDVFATCVTGTANCHFPNNWAGQELVNNTVAKLTRPWEWFIAPGSSLLGTNYTAPSAIYLDMQPGGTIVCEGGSCGNYTIADVTQNRTFFMPHVTIASFVNGTVPIVSTTQNVSVFDLLRVTCNSACNSFSDEAFQTTGAFTFLNVTDPTTLRVPVYLATGGGLYDTQLSFMDVVTKLFGNVYSNAAGFTDTLESECITGTTNGNGTAQCQTPLVPEGGSSTGNVSTPGQVSGGPYTLVEYPITMQRLVNNTMDLAYDYYVTLRAATSNGRYSIPANCAIPTPSDAIPAATDFTVYGLNANDTEAIYLAYLNAVYRGPQTTFTGITDLCGNPHLGFVFNWTGFWHPHLNVSLSVYLDNGSAPVGVNGTLDSGELYASPGTWAVVGVDPSILYPFEYTAALPVQKVIPVPVNNPMAAVLIDYPGNVLFGQTSLTPNWGVPTYLTLNGFGNYSNINGTTSTVKSGQPLPNGDAIYISSCVLNNVTQTTCNISATYFDHFSFGPVHAVTPPSPVIGGVGGFGINGQFCSSLFSWIPFLGSSISALCSFIVGLLGAVLVILVLAVAVYVVYRAATARRSPRGGGGGSTVNVYAGGRPSRRR